MSSSASLLYRITADPAPFRAGISDVAASFDFAGRKAEAFQAKLSSVGSALSLGITAPVIAFGTAAAKAALDMDSLTAGLEAVSGSSEEAQRQLVRLREVAKLPGLGFKDAVEGSIRLQAAGFSAGLAERSLKAFGNALATVGKGKAELDGVTLALSQIASKGKISAEEINQLAERVPQIRRAIQAAFGTADTEVLQRAGIGAQEFVTRVVGELEKLKTVAARPKTALENLGDTVQQSAARIGEKLLPAIERTVPKLEALAVGVANVFDVFTRLPGAVQTAGLALGGILVLAGPLAIAFRSVSASIQAVRDAYIAMTAAQAVSSGVGIAAGAVSAATAAKEVADAAARIRAAKAALDVAVGVGYAETMAAQTALKSAQGAYRAAVEAEKAAISLGSAARTATVGLGAMAGAATAGGLAVATVIGALNTSNTALEQQRKASEAAADSLKRLNDRYRDLGNASGKVKAPSFADIDREITNRTRALTGTAKTDTVFEGLISSLKRATPSVQSLFTTAGVKSVQEYQAAIDKAARLVSDLNALQSQGVNVSQNLAIARKELADAEAALANAMGKSSESSKRATKSKLELKVATLDVLIAQKQAKDRLDQYNQAIDRAAELGIKYGGVTREQIALNIQVADTLFRYFRVLENAPDVKIPGIGEGLKNLPKPEMPTFPGNFEEFKKSAKNIGELGMMTREQYEAMADAAKRSAKDQTAAMRQVSTILTDLSRGIANAAIPLIFERPRVDVSRYEEQLVELRAEQEKLLAAQRRGQNVTAALAVVQQKLTNVTRQMGEEVRKSSFGFRALEAGKAIVEDLAKAITRTLIEGALKKLTDSLLGVDKTGKGVFGNLSGLLGSVFGSGSRGGTSPVFSAVPGTTAVGLSNGGLGKLPGFGGGAGQAAGAAAGAGLSAAVGMVTGIASAVSGIIGNFQMAGMNKTLDLIEKETRYSQIHLLNILEKANDFWPWMKATHERLYELRDVGIKIENLDALRDALAPLTQMAVPSGIKSSLVSEPVSMAAGGGGTNITLSFSGATFGGGMTSADAEAMLSAAITRLKQKGLLR